MSEPRACPIRVISMADAVERRASFRARAADAPLPWTFFDAATGLVPGLTLDADAVDRNKGRALTPGEIGCYASHFSIWRDIVDQGVDQAIVLEDDVIVDWAFLARLAATDLAAEGIDYLRLYSKMPVRSRIVRRNFIHHSRSVVELVGHAYGTQGYAITRAGAARFLRHCARIVRPIDDQMDRSWAHGVRNLALHPAPIIEAAVVSGIGAARFGAGRSAAYLAPAQRVRRWVDRQRLRAYWLGGARGR
jgi:glycosyl transferase family 25